MTRALAVSFALHALLLWPGSSLTERELAASALSATLRAPERPAEPPPPAPVKAPQAPEALALPASVPDVLPEPAMTRPPRAPAAVPVVSQAIAFGEGTRSSSALQPAPDDAPDAEGLRQYRLALAREARRFKRYPARALEAGWSGTTEVRVTVAADAGSLGTAVVRGSGHEILDEAALEMLRQAVPAIRVPARLRGRAFAVSLPVVFELPD